MHAITNRKKKESREGCVEGVGEREGKKEML